MLKFLRSQSYPGFKIVIVVLLWVNVGLYAVYDTLTSTVDAMTWLVLLIMFELETLGKPLFSAKTLHVIRNILIVIIIGVFASYVRSSEWLDVANSLLWFALIALLELEIRKPDAVAGHPKIFWLTTLLVFSGLLAMVGAWAWQAAWLDVYDAVLWIAAFAAIEVDIFKFLQPKAKGYC